MISKESVQCVIDLHKKSMSFDIKLSKLSDANKEYDMTLYYNGRIDSVKAIIEDLESIIND